MANLNMDTQTKTRRDVGALPQWAQAELSILQRRNRVLTSEVTELRSKLARVSDLLAELRRMLEGK